MTVVATVSMDVDKKKPEETNLEKIFSYMEKAKTQNADLIVFPEGSIGGFGASESIDDLIGGYSAEAIDFNFSHAEFVPDGESTEAIAKKAKELGMYACFNLVELDERRQDALFNTTVLVGPEGYIGKYRKVHLPSSEQLMCVGGSRYDVFDTSIGKIGIMCCYDLSFPEVARILTIKGADIILCPTGWPISYTQSEDDQGYKLLDTWTKARAMENVVFFVTSNTGSPHCCSHSSILSPMGELLAGTKFGEGMVVADLGDLREGVRHGRAYNMMGSAQIKDRRPDTYLEIAKLDDFTFMNSKVLQESFNPHFNCISEERGV